MNRITFEVREYRAVEDGLNGKWVSMLINGNRWMGGFAENNIKDFLRVARDCGRSTWIRARKYPEYIVEMGADPVVIANMGYGIWAGDKVDFKFVKEIAS